MSCGNPTCISGTMSCGSGTSVGGTMSCGFYRNDVLRVLTYPPDDADQTPLQRAINELARNLRHVHYEGDGCVDEDVNE
jgi:hypothetical protein